MCRLLLKTKKKSLKVREQKITRGLMISATIGAWAVLVLAVMWFFAAIGWYLLARLWWQELFVPDAVFATVGAGLITLSWAILLCCSALLWANYHYRHYYKQNRRQLSPLIMQSEQPSWQESLLDSSYPSISTSIERSYAETATTLENIVSNHEHHLKEGLVIGTTLQKDFSDEKGSLILKKGEVITPKIIKRMIANGLYGKFVVQLSEQLLQSLKEGRQRVNDKH